MKYLKRYESHDDISTICQKYGIFYYTINADESIDVNSCVDLSNRSLVRLPLKFRNIEGYFTCSDNYLTTLDGSPKWVFDSFSCSRNMLTTLQGCPKYVGRNFHCFGAEIDSFEGLDFIHIGNADNVGINCGEFYCEGNPIYGVWVLFEDHTKFEFFNDCDIIREDRVIILDRLNFFLDYIDKPTVTEVEGYKCI